MPEEVMVVAVLSMLLGTGLIIFLSLLIFRAVRIRGEQKALSQSLSTSELEGMMRKAIGEALEPVQDQLDELARSQRQLAAAERKSLPEA